MKVKLNIPERIVLLGVLPKEGSFLTLKIIRDSQSIIAPSAEEIVNFDIRQVDEKVTWNEKGLEEVEFDFNQPVVDLVSKQLVELEKSNRLSMNHFSLYEKFVNVKE